MNCDVCNNINFKELFVKNGSAFLKCNQCGLIFNHPKLPENDAKRFYNKDYYNPWRLGGAEKISTERNKTLTFNRWLIKIEKYRPIGKILDTGCATGFFLETARKRGWLPYGVEISEYSAKIAQKKFGACVFTGSLIEAHFDDREFDAVTAFDLIEHLNSPEEFLVEVFRILKPGGVIAICTINAESLSYKLMGMNWPHFKPEHLYYFSPVSIKKMLHKSGFKTLRIIQAKKILSLDYIKSILEVYRIPILSDISALLYSSLPKVITEMPFCISSGEMFIIAKKD